MSVQVFVIRHDPHARLASVEDAKVDKGAFELAGAALGALFYIDDQPLDHETLPSRLMIAAPRAVRAHL